MFGRKNSGRKNLRPKKCSAENFFGRKFFRPKFFGRKTPSEGFREAVELRNKLLNQGLPEELLTPSVDILEEISVHNHHLHIIHGDPGYGKTIHLQQISERFVRQQRTSEQATMPVCIKAKHLAASIREHAKEEREINRDPEDITANNVVLSNRIADAEIVYVGAGEIADSSRQGWLSRTMRTLSPL